MLDALQAGWTNMQWQQRLTSGQVVIIDGGTGSELARRGVPMHHAIWNGLTTHTHPELVRAVHADYIDAGAEVIIANTYASNRLCLEAVGFDREIPAIIRRGVELAQEARASHAAGEVAVAGSISCHAPSYDWLAPGRRQRARDSFHEAAEALAQAGADLLVLEMLQDTVAAPLAIEAASAQGLPVWLGVSCRLDPRSGQPVGFDLQDTALTTVLDALLPYAPEVVNIMHSEAAAVGAALELTRARWDGPIGVYPESPAAGHAGHLTPDALVAAARRWVAAGARVVGGCCGTGPEHIRALVAARAELDAAAAGIDSVDEPDRRKQR